MINMNLFALFENQFLDIQCPNCFIHKMVLFKDVILNRTVICPSCENKIRLVDKDASGCSARLETQEVQREIENLFKSLGEILK